MLLSVIGFENPSFFIPFALFEPIANKPMNRCMIFKVNVQLIIAQVFIFVVIKLITWLFAHKLLDLRLLIGFSMLLVLIIAHQLLSIYPQFILPTIAQFVLVR